MHHGPDMRWLSAPARAIVIGPRMDARGGIATVNATYAEAGLFDDTDGNLSARYFPSTRDGSLFGKLAYAGMRLALFTMLPLPRPSLVHLHMTAHASFWRKAAFAFVARAKGAQVIHHIHAFSFFDFYKTGGRVRRAAIRRTLRRAACLIALTPGMARLLRHIVPDQHIEVLPNPINLKALRVDPPPPRHPRMVLFLGWFVTEKGIYDLLEAMAHAIGKIADLRLVLGGYRNEIAIRDRVRNLGLTDHVDIRGWIDRASVARLLRECTLLALPSYTEGFGLVLIEAMACGTPIVTCPVGGIPEVLRAHRNAVFVPPGDVIALSSAIIDVVLQPKLREVMSAIGPEDAKPFDVARVIAQLRVIYARVIA